LASIRGSKVSSLARKWQVSHALLNGTILSPQTFNILLTAIVDTQGSSEGMRLWQLFCNDTVPERTYFQDTAFDEYPAEDHIFAADENYDPYSQALPASDPVAANGEYVPFVEPEFDMSLLLEGEGELDAQDMMQASDVEFSDSFPVTVDETEVFENPEPRSLVRPDLRTLRIIVRGALAERRALFFKGGDSTSQTEVLEWAILMYQLLGTKNKDIEQEIQQAIDENANKIQQQMMQKTNKDRLAAYLRRKRAEEQICKPFRRPKFLLGLSRTPAPTEGPVAV
jgi:hypothetical protein